MLLQPSPLILTCFLLYTARPKRGFISIEIITDTLEGTFVLQVFNQLIGDSFRHFVLYDVNVFVFQLPRNLQ